MITGAGGDFCSGADLSGGGRRRRSERHQLAVMRHVGDAALALHRMPKPTIAKVNGVAAGAGCNLALGCDLIVASDEARFTEIFARRGLTDRLRRLVAAAAAHRPASSEGARVPRRHHLGEEAERSASSTGSCPTASSTRSSTTGRRGSPAGPPIALAQTKRLLDNAFAVTFEQALEDEGAAQTVNFGTEDTREAMMAFLEKRDPNFKGG